MTRLLLLDDRDAVGVMLREGLLSESIPIDGTPVAERIAERPRLPLALINWREDKPKFDTGPYVSTVRALGDVVQDLLAIKELKSREFDVPSDEDDDGEAGLVVENLEARLGLDDVEGYSRREVNAEIAASRDAEQSFELSRGLLKQCAEGFGKTFAERVVRVLVDLFPYQQLIDEYREIGIFESELEPWLSLDSEERRQLLNQSGSEDPESRVAAAAERVKREQFLAYKLVFQKGFVLACSEMLEMKVMVAQEWGLDDGVGDSEFLDAWIARFNTVFAGRLGDLKRVSPFYGAGIRFDETIDVTKASIQAIKGFVCWALLAPIEEWHTDDDERRKEASDCSLQGPRNQAIRASLQRRGSPSAECCRRR